jgi:hypothetical protein
LVHYGAQGKKAKAGKKSSKKQKKVEEEPEESTSEDEELPSHKAKPKSKKGAPDS